MGMEIIYDVYKDGEYYGLYRGSDIRKELSMGQEQFYTAVNQGRIIRGHYRIIPVDKTISKADSILAEFDRTVTEVSEQLERRRRA